MMSVPSLADAAGTTPAATWRRCVARLGDLATVLFVQWALTVIHVFYFVPLLVDRVHPEPWGRAFVPTALFVALTLGYEVLFVTRNEGRTPAKDLFRIKVVTRSRGERASLSAAVIRSLPICAAVFVTPWWLALVAVVAIGLPALAGPKRSLLDLISGTQVVVDPRNEEDAE